MSDPALALQGELVRALKANGGVGTGARVYGAGAVPNTPDFPYVTLGGEDQVLGDDVECADLSEVFVRIHAWSRTVGFPEVKAIAGAIRAAIKNATLSLSGFTVNEIEFVQTQYLQDPDGLTRHAVTEFRFFITHG